MTPPFEVAPAAIARIASVPIEALEALASPSLARRALEDDHDSFAECYDRVLEEHRRVLWRHTVGNPRVRCGIALSSPSLATDLRAPAPSPRRNKRARHLDTSLYRYLARAAGRLEPCGLWTSVALAELGDELETTVRSRAPQCHVAPDLGPLRDIVRALARREPYRGRGPYRLDPTLQEDAEGRWCHARRDLEGELRWTTLPRSPVWRRLAASCGDGRARSRDELAEALGPSVPGSVLDSLLTFGLEQGLLLGGLELPARFATPWDALDGVQDSLEPAHRRAWAATCEQLRQICVEVERALEASLAEPSPDAPARPEVAVLAGQQRVRTLVGALADALGVPRPTVPLAVLRCDETAPFDITLGRPDRLRLEALLRTWASLERDHHTHHRWVAGATRAMGADEGRVTSPPAPDAAPETASHPSTAPCGGPPLGALVVRPGGDGLAAPWVRGLSQAPTVTHARHAYHLAHRGDSLLPWFRAVFADLARRDGIQVVDLACSTKGSPNLYARPRYVEPLLDPWGTSSTGPSIDALRLVPGPAPSSVLLAQGTRRWSACVFTALRIPASDVITHRLMATSFDDRLAPEPDPGRDPAPSSDPSPHEDPLRRPRRWTIGDQPLEHLLAVRGAARFVRWQRLAHEHRWPRWVRVQRGARPSVLVPTDGPLALEAVLEGASPQKGPIVVEEVLDEAWLPSPRGHHLVELVLPVRRTSSAWTPRRPPALPRASERSHGNL